MEDCVTPMQCQGPKDWLRARLYAFGLWTANRHCQRVVEEVLEASEFVENNNYSTGEVIGGLCAPVTGGAAIGHRPQTKLGTTEQSAERERVGVEMNVIER